MHFSYFRWKLKTIIPTILKQWNPTFSKLTQVLQILYFLCESMIDRELNNRCRYFIENLQRDCPTSVSLLQAFWETSPKTRNEKQVPQNIFLIEDSKTFQSEKRFSDCVSLKDYSNCWPLIQISLTDYSNCWPLIQISLTDYSSCWPLIHISLTDYSNCWPLIKIFGTISKMLPYEVSKWNFIQVNNVLYIYVGIKQCEQFKKPKG